MLAPWLATSTEKHNGFPILDQTLVLEFVVLLAAAPVLIGIYAYVVYPMILSLSALVRPTRVTVAEGSEWPSVTVTVPVYNAAATIRSTLDRLLELDYPRDRLQLLVISDASTDGTDDIVLGYADRGVELLRLPNRRGKTTAENKAQEFARGEIIVNVDATILVASGSLKRLTRVFDDPTIGVASGRDISSGDADRNGTSAESNYVGYEMWVRDLETRVGSIVGASGCFYGFRRGIHATTLPPDLSWDFASALVAREQGYRSVSVPSAVCIVPRTAQIRTELRRKARTMARGLSTLFYHRALMNPFRYGGFALMLISHKLLRWLPYLLAPLSILALALLARDSVFARVLLGGVLTAIVAGMIGIRQRRPGVFMPVAIAGFILAAATAGFLAWWDAFRRAEMAMWEPTPRTDT
jgi:cellulose synthase/poly-beta-1,6-N-acetylglucosamine synthase-like glycosyltransferase